MKVAITPAVVTRPTIRFFRDNDAGVGEASSGAVSCIRLFNKPPTPVQVAAL